MHLTLSLCLGHLFDTPQCMCNFLYIYSGILILFYILLVMRVWLAKLDYSYYSVWLYHVVLNTIVVLFSFIAKKEGKLYHNYLREL